MYRKTQNGCRVRSHVKGGHIRRKRKLPFLVFLRGKCRAADEDAMDIMMSGFRGRKVNESKCRKGHEKGEIFEAVEDGCYGSI